MHQEYLEDFGQTHPTPPLRPLPIYTSVPLAMTRGCLQYGAILQRPSLQYEATDNRLGHLALQYLSLQYGAIGNSVGHLALQCLRSQHEEIMTPKSTV